MKRVLVIGARRTRQGIGEFVAQWFHQAGAAVEVVVGSTADTAAAAAVTLSERYGISARPYADLREAMVAERPDVVAICSPFDLHPEHLRVVGEVGAHCLCEKPMWWGEGVDLEAETARLVDPLLEAGFHFNLVTQWPQTLPAFYRLYPELEAKPLETFEMLLSPISIGGQAVLDCVPHVLSMLQALVGRGEVESPRATVSGPDRGELTLSFEYKRASAEPFGARVAVTGRFVTCLERPRPASYALNGCRVDRTIRMPDYTMELTSGEHDETQQGSEEPRTVVLEDPLQQLVEGFLARLDEPIPAPAEHRQRLIESVTRLEPLVREVERLEREGSS